MPSDGMSNSERFYMSLCAKELAQKRAKETTMTTNDDAPRTAYLTVRDAAARAGCDPSYLRREIAAGRLAATKVGRDWLIEPRAFAAWLRNPRRAAHAVAEARALLAKMEERASKYGWSADGAIYSLTLRRLADECDALRATVARREAERVEREAADREIPCSACHGMGLKYDKYIGYEVTCPACGGTGVYDPDAPRDDETRGAE